MSPLQGAEQEASLIGSDVSTQIPPAGGVSSLAALINISFRINSHVFVA